MEERTGRLTILIDPRKKAVFDYLCAIEDQKPSQVVRRLMREYIEDKLGHPWKPGDSIEDALRGTSLEEPLKTAVLQR
ncbi:MAG: CopG family transcriptional regulator [Nevskia sp.]|nr:CopG family transcriptional regulator [Nevskia sp.]